MKCAQCGYKNDAEANVCNLCGTKIAPAAAAAEKHEEPHPLERKGKTRGHGPPPGGTSRLSGPAGERHFLVPPIGENVRLEVGADFVLGRDEGCSLRVKSVKASRRHAEVGWKDGQPVLRDLGAQNGTFLNGGQVPHKGEAILKNGDTLMIGDLILVYRQLAPGQPESALDDPLGSIPTVRRSRPRAKGKAPPDASFEGDASVESMLRVLERILGLKASGTLAVEAGGAKGELRIEKGKPTGGRYAGLEGAPAIQAIKSLETGTFKFLARRDAPPTGKFTTLRATSPLSGAAGGGDAEEDDES